MISSGVGFRYYFDTKNAPRAIAIANPYLVGGAGLYYRDQRKFNSSTNFPASSSTVMAFGIQGGAGFEFAIYRKHIFLGLDFRYHFVFFPDENETYQNKLTLGDRSGDLFTPTLSLTYNF
jgi:hypothetical protein